jgi:hypothetical protein
MIAAGTLTTTQATTPMTRSKTDVFRYRGKDTDWQHRVLSPALATATLLTIRSKVLYISGMSWNCDSLSRSV